MDWWANIVATLSLLLAIGAFIWAILTFGKSKPRLTVELEVFEPKPISYALGSLGPVLKGVLQAQKPEAVESIRKFQTENLPALREALPALVETSPLLKKFWPSIATWFSDSAVLAITVRNDGVADTSIRAVEVGGGSQWYEVEERTIYGRFKLTDAWPASVGAGDDLEVWFPTDKVEEALGKMKLSWNDAQVRVRTTSRRAFFAKLASVTVPVRRQHE